MNPNDFIGLTVVYVGPRIKLLIERLAEPRTTTVRDVFDREDGKFVWLSSGSVLPFDDFIKKWHVVEVAREGEK